MPAKRVLHLHLEREWFDDIAEGRKRYEYRAYKDYWKKRLEGKEYDIVRFRNGYAADAPEMDVEFVRLERKGKNFVIRLGRVLKKKRWRPSAANPKFALQLPRVRLRTSGSKRH